MQMAGNFNDEKDTAISGCCILCLWTGPNIVYLLMSFVIGVVVIHLTINDYYYLKVISPPDVALLTCQNIRVRSFAIIIRLV